MQTPTKWIRCFRPRPQAKLRLVCIPFAGGGASAFRLWSDALPASIELWAVQPPGREERLAEPAFTSRRALVKDLADALAPRLTSRFCLFGHSMGARLAFELVRDLRARGARMPEHLFLSGRSAPHLPPLRPPMHALPHAEFIEAVRELNGTPKEVFDEPELLELVLPLLRADFAVNEVEPHVDAPPLPCPITALGGRDDEHASEDRLAAWRDYTSAAFTQVMFPGDHFYLVAGRQPFLDRLGGLLAPYTV